MKQTARFGRLAALSLAIGLVAPAALPTGAEAGFRRPAEDLSRGFVVAHSRHGNGSVSGPVRFTSVGPQVQLPGGTWEHCRRSCAETLRVESIDFWDSREGRGGPQGECGLLNCYDFGRILDRRY
ncbi:MAG: hypothetical protein NW205_11640 [Hyphomicrobiaceae bacterium]|nr:hypothetical protein [Hyphomicrobiaceae bacterium]